MCEALDSAGFPATWSTASKSIEGVPADSAETDPSAEFKAEEKGWGWLMSSTLGLLGSRYLFTNFYVLYSSQCFSISLSVHFCLFPFLLLALCSHCSLSLPPSSLLIV
jgi:hypothetical protein